MKCSICGVSDKTREIFEVISPTGIILACARCASDAGFPEVKRPEIRPEKEGRIDSVYETMVRLSGVRPKERVGGELMTQESKIREVMNKNYEEKMKKESFANLNSRPDLVDKFHWIIMRVRRVKGLTQKQLAERVGESENAIKMAEQGIVPPGYALLEKLETFLRVKLIKDRKFALSIVQKMETSGNISSPNPGNPMLVDEIKKIQKPAQPARLFNFDKKTLDALTIADLKRIKDQKEAAKGQDKIE